MRSCDFPRNPEEKEGYRLIFQDDFDSHILDRGKWFPYYLPQWSSKLNSKANYIIRDSLLILQIKEDQLPWCPEFDGDIKVSSLQTGGFSGPLNSGIGQHRFSKKCIVREEQVTERLFTPQFGYVEIRAKAPVNPNNVYGFWMIGYEDLPERSAEICPFELKGWQASSEEPTIGFGIHPFDDPSIEDDFHERSFNINPENFHIYAANWAPDKVEFYIDNCLVHTSNQSPQYPMQFMLNIYEIPSSVTGVQTAPLYPSEFMIDYVRFYQSL
jgi:Beta-glucanase/Beta-glucan synthetase